MKVDEQIKWQEKLWVMSSWGLKVIQIQVCIVIFVITTISRLSGFHIVLHLMKFAEMLCST